MKIALLGDIALFGSFDLKNNPDVLSNLRETAEYLKDFDHVVGNLEAPFSIKKIPHGAKSAYLCSEPTNVEILKFLHIDIVNLANNHIFDYGKEGYELTKLILNTHNIKWFGSEGKTIEIKENGNDVVLDGYCCYSTNPLKLVTHGAYGINMLDVDEISSRLKLYASENKLPIVAIHAGIEHVDTPAVDNIKMSRKWGYITPYVYYGHHPHVVQGAEFFNGSLIAHSLGNFIFDDLENLKLSEANRTGAILEIEIENNNLISYKYTSVKIDKGNISICQSDICRYQDYGHFFDTGLENPEDYTNNRNLIRSKWIANRKRKRNLKWYLNRLNLRYANLWWSNRVNAKKYKEHVTNKL